LITEAVDAFQSLMELLYVTNSKMPSWRYVEERYCIWFTFKWLELSILLSWKCSTMKGSIWWIGRPFHHRSEQTKFERKLWHWVFFFCIKLWQWVDVLYL
jgi:hypothetical protein